MSDLFYNPYQFIPVDTKRAKELTAFEAKKGSEQGDSNGLERSDNKYVRHDFWHAESVSGRIRCSLSTLSPLVIGAEQISYERTLNRPSTVVPYSLKGHGYAIPGNSLRGMVGSIAEVISQSSLRVLNASGEGDYSIRKSTNNPLTKLGLLLEEDGEYWVYPITSAQASHLYYKDNANYLKQHNCYQHFTNPEFVEVEGKKGILRIRGKSTTKKRETFIPWDGEIYPQNRIRVDSQTVEKLDRMLKSLYASQVKKEEDYESCQLWPKGYNTAERNPNSGDESKKVVLPGDLLYYHTQGDEVVELSYSSIWRKPVPGDAMTAFINSSGKNSLPWHGGRTHLTPAEALFGVVENETDKLATTRNLASRLRFCDATANDDIELDDEVTLKILNSPKPPSPAMYFSAPGGRYVSKENLDLKAHHPNGRKYYVPHPEGSQSWKHDDDLDDERNHMRLNCTPVTTGSCFYFDIYFENLSVSELGLLRTALQPSGKNGQFTHRLGLGKPYGLGHVCIESADVEVVNRQERYSLKRFMSGSKYKPYDKAPDMFLVDQEEALPALLAIADRGHYMDLPICYPYDQASTKSLHQSPDTEENGFQWFVENDRAGKNGRKDFLHRSPTSSAATKVMKPLASGKRRNQDS